MKIKKTDIPELANGSFLVDTHCHLDMIDDGKDVQTVIHRAIAAGVKKIITIGIDLESSRRATELARQFQEVWATVGMHPHNATECDAETYRHIRLLANSPRNKVVGYGEIGLDFAKEYSPREVQLNNFAAQLDMATELNLPVIIHDREAHAETMEILSAHAPFPAGGVMHCFSGDLQLAGRIIDLGLYISLPGIVTFKNSLMMQEVAREIPLENMILETDGPFLAPVPYRGKTNKPEYLIHTAQKIADLRGITLEEVARQTTSNAARLFHLDHDEPLS